MIHGEGLGHDIQALFGHDEFHPRHIGPGGASEAQMLATIGYASRQALIRDTVPAAILRDEPLAIAPPATEAAVQIAAYRKAFSRRASTIGANMTSGGMGKKELSAKETAARAQGARREPARDRTFW